MNVITNSSKTWIAPSALFVLALFLRIGAWFHNPCISRDGIFYLRMAQQMAELSPGIYYQEHPLIWIPPFYPQLVSLGIRLGLPAEFCGVSLNLLAGSGSVVLLFLAIRHLSSQPLLAWYTALIAAFAPGLLHLSGMCQREMCYFFFSTLFFYGAVRLVKGSDFWSIFCAAAATLGYCTRVEALELFLIFPLIVIGKIWYQYRGRASRGIRCFSWETVWRPLLLFCGSVLLFFCLENFFFSLPWSFLQRQLFRWLCRIASWF